MARIEVSPNGATLRTGEQLSLTAVGYDAENKLIQGLSFTWKAVEFYQTEEGKKFTEKLKAKQGEKTAPNNQPRPQIPEKVLLDGVFQANSAGMFLVIAEAGGVEGKGLFTVNKDGQFQAMREVNEAERLNNDAEAQRRGKKLTFSTSTENYLKKQRGRSINNSTKMSSEQLRELDQWDKAEKQRSKEEENKQKLNGNPNKQGIISTEKSEQPGEEADFNNGQARYLVKPEKEEYNLVENIEDSEIGSSEINNGKSQSLSGYVYANSSNYTASGSLYGGGYGGSYGSAVINVYVDGASIGSTSCYLSGGSCGWSVAIPSQYRDGNNHTISAQVYYYYSGYVTLSGSGQTFNFPAVTDPNWNNNNFPTADDPGLQPGNPANTGTDGAGSSNFSFSAPVISLGGRGMDVNLSLNYNSLLWHNANGFITYDIDKGNPAPGWNLGFGKMMDMDTQGGAMIEDLDGTRHSYEGTIQAGWTTGYSTYYGRTTDGSFIDYESSRTPAGISSGVAYLANGTQIIYGAAVNGVAYEVV